MCRVRRADDPPATASKSGDVDLVPAVPASGMHEAAVSAALEEYSEELAFPESVRAVSVKDSTGASFTLGALLDARPRAALVLGRNLL